MEHSGAGLHVQFWGVRGSIPTPHAANMRYGGNTACVEVRLQGGPPVVLDAGTGIRRLGLELRGCPLIHLLLTHFHWDHIQGLPFFDPLHHPAQTLDVWSSAPPARLQATLEQQMSTPYFPVNLTEPPRRPSYNQATGHGFEVGGIKVQPIELHHPGGSTGYKLSANGASVVYATDHEPGSAVHDAALLEVAAGADLLIIDSQYTPEEHQAREGWGHGTWLDSARTAREAGVKRLILFHHDPARDDEAVAALVENARTEFFPTEAAREGWTIQI
ncbi:MAG: MBL fold metallo-hydrolase [Acidimicrobiia bacterium]|nr:MBL fold metallo-hydrolase [Acidimicrobiia bacterium]